MIFLKHFIQENKNDCGPVCLEFLAHWYNLEVTSTEARKLCEMSSKGTSMSKLIGAFENIGLVAICVNIDLNKLINTVQKMPCVLLFDQKHYVVLYKYRKSFLFKHERFYISDPAMGQRILNNENFSKLWLSNASKGYCIVVGKR